MHLTVLAITDTTFKLELFWPNPKRDSDRTVSVCGQSDEYKNDSFLLPFLVCHHHHY